MTRTLRLLLAMLTRPQPADCPPDCSCHSLTPALPPPLPIRPVRPRPSAELSPEPKDGCHWCGAQPDRHGRQWSATRGRHTWEPAPNRRVDTEEGPRP